MHPAYSVIFFTTASGAGYGLLTLLGLLHAFGAGPGRWVGLAALTLGLVLVAAGLLSSTFHLGHPERAWRALSQWRSSWLSREGVLAVVTFVPAGLMWLAVALGMSGGALVLLGLLTAAGAMATVWSTGMIYASLRTVRQWNRPDVVPIYMVLALGTGALLLTPFVAGGAAGGLVALCAIAGLLAAGALKWRYWQEIDADAGRYTAEQATGLGHIGKVRPLEPPHTMPNFVMREMGYKVGRRHSAKLRLIVTVALALVPALLAFTGLLSGALLPLSAVAVPVAALGVFVERWLFFAEAEHVSMLFYGATRA